MTRALDLILAQPWAIQPDSLETLLSIASRTNASPEAVAAQLGRPLDNARTVNVRDGTAIVPVTGPIFRRANLFTEVSGATSVEVLASDLATAAADPAIERIVLEIDSPGGQATGILELAHQIRAIDQAQKPVVAYVDGLAASAAYWLASAAGEIVASPSALLGSIGVVGTYRPEKDAPIKLISAVSPLKQATPDTEAGRAEMQRVIDELAALFVTDVAAYRRTTPERVISDFGRGGVLVGQAAVAAGMADRLGNFEGLFSTDATAKPSATIGAVMPGSLVRFDPAAVLRETLSLTTASAPRGPGSLNANPHEELAMSHLQAAGTPNPAPANPAPAITEADLKAAEVLGHEAGVSAERARVTAILAAHQEAAGLPLGLATVAIAQGLSAEAAAAMIAAAPAPAAAPAASVEHDPAARSTYRAAWLADGQQGIPATASATGDPGEEGDDDAGDPEARLARAWQADAQLRAEFGGDFDRYAAFSTAIAAGRVKILREGRSRAAA